jgi:hypothetical protein
MKELEPLALRLREALTSKEKELSEAGQLSATAVSLLQNRENQVKFFEDRIRAASTDPTLRTTIVNNFKKDAKSIEDEIASIK